MSKPYNFFGQTPIPQAFSPPVMPAVDPSFAYNNPSQSSSAMPSISPEVLAKMMKYADKTESQQQMGVGTGLSPQFAQGILDPNMPVQPVGGDTLNQQFGNAVMGKTPRLYDLNGVWNG